MATYYVDQTSGNDSSADPTNIATPWKTVAKVNSSSFSADDQILFKRGEVWRETLTVPSSGTSGHPIIFGAYGSGADPIIAGSDLVTSGWIPYLSNIGAVIAGAGSVTADLGGTSSSTASVWLGTTNAQPTPTSGTVYYPAIGSISSQATETNRILVMPTAGVIDCLYIGLSASPGTALAFTLVKNGTPDTLTCTVTAPATSANDTSNSVTVAAGDLISLKCDATATATAVQAGWGLRFTPTTSNETVLAFGSGTTGLAQSGTQYMSPCGVSVLTSVAVGDAQIVMPCAGTLTKIEAHLASSPGSGKSRIFAANLDGSDTALTVTIADTNTTNRATGSVSVSAGQLLVITSNITGSSPTAAAGHVSLVFTPTTSGQFILAKPAAAAAMNTGATRYMSPQGYNTAVQSTRTTVMEIAPAGFTAKAIYIVLSAAPNGAGKSYTFTLYDGTGSTSLTKAIENAATTGNYATDVSITVAHELSINCTPANTPDSATAMVSILGAI